jgi:hypothetical protein
MTLFTLIDEKMLEELEKQPYNPPQLAGPADEWRFDREFEAHVMALKETLKRCGYIEEYDEIQPGERPHYLLSDEHGADRTIGMELLHSVMARECSTWVPEVQLHLTGMSPRYQVVAVTDFYDPEGIRVRGLAWLVIRLDVVFACFSTPEIAELFGVLS